jgi:hypothetical protein
MILALANIILVVEGDCGSWVVDRENGQLYGQIVAGHPGSGVGYVIPASQIFESVLQTLGDALLLPSGVSAKSPSAIAQAGPGYIPRRKESDEPERYREEREYYDRPKPSKPIVKRNRPPEARQVMVKDNSPSPSIAISHHDYSSISRSQTTPWHESFLSTVPSNVRQSTQDELRFIFSDQNLSKDLRLRSYMDSGGYITVAHLTSASRLRGESPNLIRAICGTLHFLELGVGQDGLDRVRIRYGWKDWVLPSEQRHASLKSTPYQDIDMKAYSGENTYKSSIVEKHPRYTQPMTAGEEKAQETINKAYFESRVMDERGEPKRQSGRGEKRQPSSMGTPYEDPNDKAIARILQRNEKDARRSENRDPSPIDPARPIYTKLSRRHLSLETLRVHGLDHEIDPVR